MTDKDEWTAGPVYPVARQQAMADFPETTVYIDLGQKMELVSWDMVEIMEIDTDD